MFQPITLDQTIEFVLLQKWIMEVILKEFKDSNESGGKVQWTLQES